MATHLQVLQPYRFIRPKSGAKLHRASIVYEFEQYRQKPLEYRAKIWLAIWMQKAGSAFHMLPRHVRFSFDCNLASSISAMDATKSEEEAVSGIAKNLS